MITPLDGSDLKVVLIIIDETSQRPRVSPKNRKQNESY